MRARGAAALGAGFTALLGGACFYSPPPELPSSVRVLYSKATDDSLGDRTDIYFIVARAGNELQLTGESGVDRQPVFVRGLRKVFFTRSADGRDAIWSMNLDGSEEEQVAGAAGADLRDPAISPDEQRLAYARVENGRSAVWTAEIGGTNPQPLTGGDGASQPAWSPDGRTLALVAEPGDQGRVVLVDAVGGATRPLTSTAGTGQSRPAWSPDGKRIAFTSGTGSAAEIAIADVATGAVDRLTENSAEDRSPAWSPSGERLVFVSRRAEGRSNLWLMDAEGGDVQALTRSKKSDAADPIWF